MRLSEPYQWRWLQFVCNMESKVKSENRVLDPNLAVAQATFVAEAMGRGTLICRF